MMGGQRLRGFEHVDVSSVAVHPLIQANHGDETQDVLSIGHPGKSLPGSENIFPQALLVGFPLPREIFRVVLVGQAPGDHGHAVLEIREPRNFHAQTEAVQQLGPQLPLLRIHGAHQDEAGRMLKRDALPLHHVDAHGRRVQQHVHQVVVQEIDLIHIKDAPVGRSQKSRIKVFFAGLDGLLQVNGAQQPVRGGAQRHVHPRHGPIAHRELLSRGQTLPAGVAHKLHLLRMALKGTAGHHGDGRQQLRQPPSRSGFGRALLPPHQHPAQQGIDGV